MKAKQIFILLLVGLMISPSITAFSQNESKFGDDPEACKVNISLYQEFFRQWKESKYKSDVVDDAIDPWRKVLLGCPAAQQSTYTNGVKIMTYRINNEDDKELRERYIDTLMMLYDMRIEYFGKEGSNLARKGADFYKYRTQEFEEANAIFARSIELLGNKSQGAILNYYFRTTAKMVNEEVVEKVKIIEAYDLVSEIIDFNIKKEAANAKKVERWKNTKGNIEAQFEPFATCEDLVSIYQGKFDQNSEDIELLKKITDILDKKKCVETQLYLDASVKLYELEPTPASAYLIGKIYLKEQNYSEAVKYFTEATAVEDEEAKAKIYYYLALANKSLGKSIEARRNARQAIGVNPNYGDAYILIGDLYGAAAPSCGDNDLTKRVGYWAAVDQYVKAKKVDPEVAEVANERIREYSKHYPTTETIFFYNLVEGESYKIECWIGETTRIRAAK